MKILFRVDASPQLGMGHISRCLSIGLQFMKMGVDVTFLVSNTFAVNSLNEVNIPYYILPSENAYKIEETSTLKNYGDLINQSMMIVDSYYASDDYLEAMDSFIPTIYFDGLYRCRADITGIINYNAAADIEEYRMRFMNKKTELLIGLDYVPVKEVFIHASKRRQEKKSNDGRPYRILLTTGATDHYDVIEKVCLRMERIDSFLFDFYVVLGKGYEKTSYIREMSLKRNNLHIFHDITPKEMALLMTDMDIAISAAGTTVYELLCVGVPTIVFGTVDVHNSFKSLQPAILWYGDIRSDSKRKTNQKVNDIIDKALMLCTEYDQRKVITNEATSRVDGFGAWRICKKILSLNVLNNYENV